MQKYPTTSSGTSASTTKRPVKINGYTHAKLHAKEKRKADAAYDRQGKYEALTVEQRIKLAQSRRGENKREIARLTKMLSTMNVVIAGPSPADLAKAPKQKKSKTVKV
jgi:hypothetical protein